MPRTNSRGNHGGPKVEVHHISGGTATDNYVPTSQGDGTAAWEAQAGGGGTPGGSNTQLQYNNAGAFGGTTGATTSGGAVTLVAPILGTPASGTLTNCTGLPLAGLVAVTASRLLGNDGSGTACEELTPNTTEFQFGTASIALKNKVVATITRIVQPATVFAAEDVLAGGSTPAENFPYKAFDGTATIEYMDFYGFMHENYTGAVGVTIKLCAIAASATSGTFVYEAAFRRFQDDALPLATSLSYAYNSSGSVTTSNVAGEPKYFTITFTNGADMESVAAGEAFILRVRRKYDASGGPTDDIGSDVRLLDWYTHIVET